MRLATFGERMQAANELLHVIGSCGRRFFSHRLPEGVERYSRFALQGHSLRIYFVDSYSDKHILVRDDCREWKGFTNGGTLRALVLSLAEFIRSGKQLQHGLGPWSPEYCKGDLWGYGDAMEKVRSEARRLGISPPPQSEEPR